jgi:hypothetical protein
LTVWENRLERYGSLNSLHGESKPCFCNGGGVCQQLEQGFPTNMELNMTTAPTVQALFFRAERKSKTQIITHHTAPAWKKLWWRIRLFFINRRYSKRKKSV